MLCAESVAAGEPVALPSYFMGIPRKDDFCTYEDQSGGQHTVRVLSAEPLKRGWVIEYTRGLNTQTYREYAIPGKGWLVEHLLGTPLQRPKLRAPVFAELPHRLPKLALSRRIEHPALIPRRERRTLESTLVGFESIETPVASYPSVLRMDTQETLEIRSRSGHDVLRRMWRHWYAPGIGLVASEGAETLTGVPDQWLVAARINDIVLPPAAP